MFIIPTQQLDKIVNDHFGSGDAQTQSTNDEAELQEQPRAGGARWPTWLGKNESRPLFLTHCKYVDKSFIEMFFE